MENLGNYLDANLDVVMEEMEELISEIIPEVVQSYDWKEDEEEGYEMNEHEWYDSYSHTTGHQAEYEAAEQWLREHNFEESEHNQFTLLERCEIEHI